MVDARRSLFHEMSGVGKLLKRAKGEELPSNEVWDIIIRYARRQIRRSSAARTKKQKEAERKVVEAAQAVEGDDDDSRYRRTWGRLREQKPTVALQNIRRDDKKDGR